MNQKLCHVTNVLRFRLAKQIFWNESAAMATQASGLKIHLSVFRFRPGHCFQRQNISLSESATHPLIGV